jgi:hypothetical protein
MNSGDWKLLKKKSETDWNFLRNKREGSARDSWMSRRERNASKKRKSRGNKKPKRMS